MSLAEAICVTVISALNMEIPVPTHFCVALALALSVATWGPTQVAREMHKNSQIVAKKYFEVAKKVAKY